MGNNLGNGAAGPRNSDGLTLEEFLQRYDPDKYRHPSVTVDMVVFTLAEHEGRPELAVLLIRRGDHPFIGSYALPGGFLNMDEPAWAAAARELEEETGVSGLTMRQFGCFSAPGRDPRTRIITIGHYALAPKGSICPRAGDDAAFAGLFRVKAELCAYSAPAERYRILLAGEESFCCQARLCYDPMGAMPQPAEEGAHHLAGDHAHVLFSALCALALLPRRRAARLLAGSRAGERAAVLALERALGCLPRRM